MVVVQTHGSEDRHLEDTGNIEVSVPQPYAGLTGPVDSSPGTRPRWGRRRRRWTAVAVAVAAAFALGMAANAFVIHLGPARSAAKLMIAPPPTIQPNPAKPSIRHAPKSATTSGSLTWHPPSALAGISVPESVSCPSANFCAVADNQGTVAFYQNQRWTPTINVDGSTQLNSVSCVNSSFCAAVDQAGNSLIYHGVTWSPPARVDKTAFDELTSVSCATASFCAAVDGDGNALTYNGKTWSPPDQIDPQGWTSVSRDQPSVSCPVEGFCVGTDSQGDVFYYVGGVWQNASNPNPGNTTSTTSYQNAVACASATFCVTAQNPGAALSYNGTQWSQPVTIDENDFIASLSCPSTTFCVAVDGLLPAGFAPGNGTGQAMIFDGLAWSPPQNIDNGEVIDSISCPSQQFCMAVDHAGQAVIGTGRLASPHQPVR